MLTLWYYMRTSRYFTRELYTPPKRERRLTERMLATTDQPIDAAQDAPIIFVHNEQIDTTQPQASNEPGVRVQLFPHSDAPITLIQRHQFIFSPIEIILKPGDRLEIGS
jgi:hypothetical protein